MKNNWWKEAVGYQIYPRSFKDSNGDGVGDLQGIIQELDYLKELGVDLIWITPIYDSPNVDNGYDVRDYKKIGTEYGTMEDFDQLLEEVHRRDMKLIMDLVLNHTSIEHEWFKKSRESKDNPYRDFYIWREAKNGKEPNNWEAIWGGSMWTFDEKTEEYYLHIFAEEQPDLNWENPRVREAIYEMITWWLDKGVDGFRIDALSHLKKMPGLPDMPIAGEDPLNKKAGYLNVRGIEVFLEELNMFFSSYPRELVTVGEASGVTSLHATDWVGEADEKINMLFQFEHLKTSGRHNYQGLNLPNFRQALTAWQEALEEDGWNALFMENHDLPRSISVWGDDKESREASAKALATVYFLMRGTPFIYQGQEIGMKNIPFNDISEINDVDSRQFYMSMLQQGTAPEQIMDALSKSSRDHARTPMHWNDTHYGGFTDGIPWIQAMGDVSINVEDQKQRSDSILSYYKQLIQLRKSTSALLYGKYDLILPNHDQVYGYRRTLNDEQYIILANLFGDPAEVPVPEGVSERLEPLLCNYEEAGQQDSAANIHLMPYEARVYKMK